MKKELKMSFQLVHNLQNNTFKIEIDLLNLKSQKKALKMSEYIMSAIKEKYPV